MQIKQGRYTVDPKGYITYPISDDTNSMLLSAALLRERRRTDTIIMFKNDKNTNNQFQMSVALREHLNLNNHITTTKKTITATLGRTELTANSIPVEIRKMVVGSHVVGIRIRVTEKTEGALLKTIETVIDFLKEYGIKPVQCVWSQGSWTESKPKQKKLTNIEIEQKKMRNIIEDMQDKIHHLEKPIAIKAAREEHLVKIGVIS